MAKKHPSARPASVSAPAPDTPFQWPLWLPVLAAVAVFSIILTFQMTGVDDHAATVENPVVRDFSLTALFSHFNLGMYAPLTWLGYAMAYPFGGADGANPWSYHLLSLLVHLYSTWLVTRLLLRLQVQRNVAVLTALLFAVHPIQVESVAWIAGFSTPLFSMLSLLAAHFWLDYAHEGKGAARNGLAIIVFIAACLAKSAAVTLPLMLLVLDAWKTGKWLDRSRLLQYIPLFAISLFFGGLTIYSRTQANMVIGVSDLSYTWWERLVLVAYTPVFYWAKMLWPLHLNIYYSFDKAGGSLPWYYFTAPIVWVAVLGAAWKYRRQAPYLLVGLAFFMANIVVTLPFAPMGQFELRADHYNYLAAIGIFYLLLEGSRQLAATRGRGWATTVTGIWVAFCVVLGFIQVRTWKDTLTVVSNAIDHGFYQQGMMYFARGVEYGDLRRPQEAIKDFTSAIELKPDMKDAYKFRGSLYAQAGQIDLAQKDLEKYLEYDPADVVTWNNMAMIYMRKNQLDKSLAAFTKAIELKPDAAISWQNRARIHQMMGNAEKANEDIRKAKELATAPKE